MNIYLKKIQSTMKTLTYAEWVKPHHVAAWMLSANATFDSIEPRNWTREIVRAINDAASAGEGLSEQLAYTYGLTTRNKS